VSRFQVKLIAVLAGLVLVVVATAGAVATRSLRELETSRIEQGLVDRAHLVLELRAALPAGATSSTLQRFAERAGEVAKARVTLIRPDGRVVGDSRVVGSEVGSLDNHAARPEVAAAFRGEIGRSSRWSDTLRRRLMYVAVPPDEAANGEVVRLAVDLAEVDASAAALRRELLLAGAVGLAGALVLSYIISRLTLRPVGQLREVVAAIADGKLERRLRWPARDELGEIAASINRLAEQMHERLAEATAEKVQLEAVLTSMVEGVLVLDAEGRIKLANPRLQELLDVWEDPRGRRPRDLVRNQALHQAIFDATSSGEPVVREIEIERPEPRFLLMHAVAVPASAGGGCVAVFHDESEVRRLDRVRRDFLANASHELRTPLTSIQGFAATLLGNSTSPEERDKYLDVISRNAERLSSLIDDLLELSKIEGRREMLRPSEVDVGAVACMLLEDLAPRLAQRGISARPDVSDDATAWADRRAVEQVLTNLLDNAIKYSHENGEIRVSIRSSTGRLEVAVSDSGVGIPAEDIDRVFERFYRVDKARSRALGGTGLGLAIVKHLVQGMGGEIRVESEPGVGSTFTFWLPRRPAPAD